MLCTKGDIGASIGGSMRYIEASMGLLGTVWDYWGQYGDY